MTPIRHPRAGRTGARTVQVCVLDADPGLGWRLSASELAAAREHSLAPLRTLSEGVWRPGDEHFDEDAMGLLVLDGVLQRRLALGGRVSCELLGEGDLLRPWQIEDEDSSMPVTHDWRVRAAAPIAVLNADVVQRLSQWPSVLGELAGRTMRRSRALAMRMAIAQAPSLELPSNCCSGIWPIAGVASGVAA